MVDRRPVWKKMKPPYTVRMNGFTYADLPLNAKYYSVEKYLPEHFDMVWMFLEDGKKIRGWWAGNEWISRHLKGRKVLGWQRINGEY